MPDNDPFQTNEGSYLDRLVGEGKKFSDQEALARGKWESDSMIETLKAELVATREAAKNGKSVADLLKALEQPQEPNALGTPPNQAQASNSIKEEDIEAIALKTLERTERTRAAESNYTQAVNKMDEVWGNDAGKQLNAVAKQLNLSVEYLKNFAMQSPAGFFQLVGLNGNRTAPSGTAVAPSTVALGSVTYKDRTAMYYRDLRKNNRALYNDSKTQIQMHKDALRIGEAYFD